MDPEYHKITVKGNDSASIKSEFAGKRKDLTNTFSASGVGTQLNTAKTETKGIFTLKKDAEKSGARVTRFEVENTTVEAVLEEAEKVGSLNDYDVKFEASQYLELTGPQRAALKGERPTPPAGPYDLRRGSSLERYSLGRR